MTSTREEASQAEALRQMYDLAIDLLGIAGFDGFFKELNAAWERTLGFTRDELLQRSFYDFVHPEDQEATTAMMRRLDAEGRVSLFENRYRTKDGSYRWLQWSVVAEVGTERIYFFSARDITERKLAERRLKESEEKLREALERARATAEELEQQNKLLEAEITERERVQADLALQQRTILAMSAPIIRAWSGVLVLPLIGGLDASRAALITDQLLAEIVRTRSRFAILDLTGVHGVDAGTAGHIVSIAGAVSLLGSACLLSGISAAVARALVEIDASLQGLQVFGQLEDSLRHALTHSDAPLAVASSSARQRA